MTESTSKGPASRASTRSSAAKSKTADSAPAAAAASEERFLEHAIVLKRGKKKKKRKKRYTRGTKPLQRFSFGLARAGYRTANSVSEGLNTFVKESNKSRRKKRDGLVRDVLRNASRGFSDGATELGKAPNEIAKRIGTRRVWRIARVITPFGLWN